MSELTKRTDDDDELPGCLMLAQGIAEQRWPHTMDAQLWAVKWKEAIAANPDIPHDEGTMIGWFANAIMAGYDTAQMRSQRQPEREGWVSGMEEAERIVRDLRESHQHGTGECKTACDFVTAWETAEQLIHLAAGEPPSNPRRSDG